MSKQSWKFAKIWPDIRASSWAAAGESPPLATEYDQCPGEVSAPLTLSGAIMSIVPFGRCALNPGHHEPCSLSGPHAGKDPKNFVGRKRQVAR
jgi:hypothetical protein